MPYTVEVPGHGVVEVPDGVSLQQAQIEIEKAFPYTGEDIAGAMQDPTFTPTKSDYLKFEEYSKTKQVDWINTAAQAADAAIGMIGGAISEGAQGAAANPLNYIEGFAQGTRQLYGLAAQSQDPSSALFKFKDLVAGTGTPESRYNQFLDARQFGITSARLERGEEGIVVPPEYFNPEYVQGVSMILDPTLFVPGVGEILGTGKLATRAVGKGAQLTGRAVAGVARPLERFAGAAERIAAETIGTTPEAFRNVASTAGIAGALGIAPEAAAFAAIPAGIRTAREAGEALSRAGENLMTQPSRIGPLEAIGAAPGANLRQRMLGVIGQYGGDAAVDASLRGLAGGIEGGVIGTGLGYLSGGEEGAAAGLGSGGVQGVAGALGGRAYQKLTGAAAKEARAGDLGRFIDGQQDPTTKALFERLRDTHGVDAASGLMDLQGLVRGKLGDVEVEYLSNEDFTKRYKISARGVQVDDKGGRPAVVINADIIGKGKGDGPLYTLGHELFHALEKSTQLQGGATEIKNALVGRWIQEGDTIRKLSEGAFSDVDIEARFNQYRDKLGAGNASMADDLAQYDTINKKADYVASELAAEHFAGLLAGQKPDALLKGFTGLTRQLVDLALTQNASRALAEAAATIERTFGVKPTDSVLFPDLKKASPQVNAMLRDLLRARRKLDEKINIQDDKTKAVLKPEDVANPLAAKQLIELGLAEQMPDGTVRAMSTDEILAQEKKDQDGINAIIENTPGNSRMVDGVALGRLSPNQLSAIEQSQTVSSRMKDRIRSIDATMEAGSSLNITYSAALKKILNRLTGKKVNRYSSGIRLSDRDMLPYSFYFSKAANPVVKAIDISKVRNAILKDTASNGSVGKGLWDNVDGFMGDLAKYFTNLDQKEGARRSSEIFGLEKAKYLGDFVGAAEKGESKFIRDFRLDRIGSMAPSGFRARFSEEAYQLSKQRWMPAEKLGDKSITNSDEGYRIISGAKHKLYGTDGKLIGIYDTQTQAERKADATQTRLQPEVRQQQRPLGDEVRQATEAGGRNRAVGGQEGQGQGGAVRQEGDVRFMPEEEPGEGQALRVGKQFTPEERKAISIANKKSLETFQRFPEAKRLEIQKDRQGNTKFKKVLDENENPVLGPNGKPIMEVAFAKVPYKLVKSPKLSKKEPRAVVQAADLLETDARKAFNNPSISKGIGWYSTMRNFLQNQFGANIEVFGQLLGATSARTPVDTNFKQALEAIKLLSTGQYDGLLADFSKHVEKTYADSKSGELLKQWQEKNPDKKLSAFKTDDQIRKQINQFKGVPLRSNGRKYNANSQKVLHVLHGIWLQQTVGPKTPNFAGNLTGRTLKATIDVWAARNLRRLLYEGSLEKWRILPEQESGVTNKDFFFAQKVYEDVGKRLGMNADDLQALMWFMEKDVWEKNGWTSTVGAEKSSFDKEAGKLALDRYQAGVTTFTSADKYSPEVQEQERLALRKSISNIPGITSSRVTHSDGLYGNTPEPSLDVEFVVQRNKDGSSQDISAQVSEILRIANEQGRKQMDVFVSKVVDANHPNARPMVEVGFKKPASKKDVKAVVEAFRSNGIDGFTMAKDGRGNVIGIRSQYIPEISARFDTVEHVDQAKTFDFAKIWITNVKKSLSAVEQIDNVSYKTPGWVSTTVYGIEEYSAAKPKDNGATSLGDELGRRRAVLDSGQVSDGPSSVEGMDPGAGGLQTPAGDVQPTGSPSQEGVAGQRFMPSDTDYLSAVKQGNTKAAQQMVDEAAKAAGYTTKVFHGSISQFNKPNTPLFLGDEGTAMSYAQDRAMAYGEGANPVTYKIYAKFKNTASESDVKQAAMDLGLEVENDMAYTALDPQISGSKYVSRVISELKKRGYDSANIDDFSPESAQNVIKSFVAFDPSQLKRSDPVTYDDNGNVIPLSKRFQQTSEDIRYMPSDDEYLNAVKRGNTQATQDMVDAAAKAAGYTIGPVYHGTPTGGFNVFDKRMRGETSGVARQAFSFTTDKQAAEGYSKRLGDEAVRLDAGLRVANDAMRMFDEDIAAQEYFSSKGYTSVDDGMLPEFDWGSIDNVPEFIKELRGYAKDLKPINKKLSDNFVEAAKVMTTTKAVPEVKRVFLRIPENAPVFQATPATLGQVMSGFNAEKQPTKAGIVELPSGDRIYYVADSSQVKLADPVTKDLNGNVIPLSQRFKATSDDIRYMPAGDMATGRSVKDYGEAVDLFEKGYRLYGAPYDGMEDPIRLKKVTEIENYDPENLWAVPSKKIAAAISIRNMPAGLMPSSDSAMPGAYSFPGGYRALPGKAKGSLRIYGPAGSLIGIASSLDEAQRILRRKNK